MIFITRVRVWLTGSKDCGNMDFAENPCQECGVISVLDPSQRICWDCWAALDLKAHEEEWLCTSVYTLVYMASKVIRIKEDGKWKNVPWDGSFSQERVIKTRCECKRCEKWTFVSTNVNDAGHGTAHVGDYYETKMPESNTIYIEVSKEMLS